MVTPLFRPVSDHIERTLEDFRLKLERAEIEVSRLKRAMNAVCEVAGKELMFADVDAPASRLQTAFANDAFHGKKLATCIKLVLEARKASNAGAATLDEIYTVLLKHGYHFTGKEDNRKRILSNMLRKNQDFYRLPHGGYGLRAWYGKIKSAKEGHQDDGPDDDSGDEPDDDSGEDSGMDSVLEEDEQEEVQTLML